MSSKSWIKMSLVFCAVIFIGVLPDSLADADTQKFETPLPKVGSIEWQNLHDQAKQTQELYRKRLSIPGMVNARVTAGGDALFAKPALAAPVIPAAISSSGVLYRFFIFILLLLFCVVFLVRQLAPHIFERANPLANEVKTAGRTSEEIRLEEESFKKFLATFRVGPESGANEDMPGMAEFRGRFYNRFSRRLVTQRRLLQDIAREVNDSLRRKMLAELFEEISALKSEADSPELLPVWQMSFAMEGLLKQLVGKIRHLTPSTLQTLTGGLDLLDDLCAAEIKPNVLNSRPFRFLVVDDDMISREALSLALSKVFNQPDMAENGEAALTSARQQVYDVIFLDVQMPGMDGFEVCSKIHETKTNRATPVVFVTVLNDFDARVQSALSGGSDLLAKPFLVFEVTLKALTLSLRARLQAVVDKPLTKSVNPVREKIEAPAPIVERQSLVVPMMPDGLTTAEMDGFAAAFIDRASRNLEPLREICQSVLQASDMETRQNLLAEGFLQLNALASQDDSGLIHPGYLLSVALEGLFRKLLADPKHSTPSALLTLAEAANLLGDLCVPGIKADLAVNPPIQLLVVDDDLVMRRAVVGALQTAFNKPENVESGEAALALLNEKMFDAIFLDVQMPGMNGFETCEKIRENESHQDTPVIYLTALNDFDVYPRTKFDRHTNLMGKPFLVAEINLKALTFVLRGRLQKNSKMVL